MHAINTLSFGLPPPGTHEPHEPWDASYAQPLAAANQESLASMRAVVANSEFLAFKIRNQREGGKRGPVAEYIMPSPVTAARVRAFVRAVLARSVPPTVQWSNEPVLAGGRREPASSDFWCKRYGREGGESVPWCERYDDRCEEAYRDDHGLFHLTAARWRGFLEDNAGVDILVYVCSGFDWRGMSMTGRSRCLQS